jgi:PPK2 family polyphosphate:nucleotide phosphotransferase
MMAPATMMTPTKSRYLVPFRGSFRAEDAATGPPGHADAEALKERLAELLDEIVDQQKRLIAGDEHAVLLVFQGLDAAGKDGSIRALTRGLDAAGCQVASFKVPSSEELDHDFLWRIHRRCPERGTIGMFNRSHYEAVLVVRIMPTALEAERLPRARAGRDFWDDRLTSIRELEHHLARNGTTIRKFWLNVSAKEQARRLLARVREAKSHWKFSAQDLDKHHQRAAYLSAYTQALRATSRPWAPWYAIPADDKHYSRVVIAEIVLDTLKSLRLDWPVPDEEQVAAMKRVDAALSKELRSKTRRARRR